MNDAPSSVQSWIKATRPATLLAGAVPVLVALAMSWGQTDFRLDMALIALVCALLIQIATNFANDYYDFIKGADTDERVGPSRATQQGWIDPKAMKKATVLVLALAFCLGCVLIARGGWPIAVLGVLSLFFAVGYTAGPAPLAYLGLGDVFVLAFFGLGATVGSVWVMTLQAPASAWLIGAALGALATAVLVVNNLRDRHTDAVAGKKTWAVRFGGAFVRGEYLLCLIAAFGLVAFGVVAEHLPLGCALVVLSVPAAIKNAKDVFSREGASLNPLLGATARHEAFFGLLIAVGWWI